VVMSRHNNVCARERRSSRVNPISDASTNSFRRFASGDGDGVDVIPLSYASMARPKTTDGDIDSLGALLVACFGLDREWMESGKCRDYNLIHHIPHFKPTPWQVEDVQRIDGMRGRELISAALIVCHSCPSQYSCADYALRGRMKAGTWAMRIGELEWLQHQQDGERIIAKAERLGVPVQIHVDSTRKARSRPNMSA